ncbi:hypothetical protein AV521_31420 [Streptomyces sp. IMTB 2501]|uniref:hypothetical protein n=1 Tax=Streptomyces sp. IMTB 2501 TaxID=1776340 RepID=UPI00096CD9C3|nr:hypothetical protein [Streptomyces sp. IMTB 2501]OLZ65566.1 hypothetical protein AV521_31420 [Streptomyces sp. IMTB 2501]
MRKNFVGWVLIGSSLLTGIAGIGTATPASAASCSYTGRYGTQNIYTPQGEHVGYVELLYASACRSVEAHFHVDSTFRANHSGWNVDLSLYTDKAAPALAENSHSLNSSLSDFETPPASIDGYPTMQFTAFLGWVYNTCSIDAASNWWDFYTGTPTANTWGSVKC